MKHILGLAGHPDTNKQVKKIIYNAFDNIDIFEIDVPNEPGTNFIRRKTAEIETKCSGLLFTDKNLYHLFHNRTRINIRSAYLEDFKPEIIKTLFKANLDGDKDVMNISIDSITYDEIKAVYDELDLSGHAGCRLLTIPFELADTGVVEKITSAHKRNHKEFGSTCITFFTETRNRLEEYKIPVLRVGTNRDEVLRKVNEFIAKTTVKPHETADRIAVVIILGRLKEHLILDSTEHNVVAEYNRISEAVYWFSEKIDGAYIPNDQRKYIIFCDKDKYEKETDFSVNIDVLNEVSKKNYFTCSMGIGYGNSERDAVRNATIAQIKAAKENRSCAYINYGKNSVAGPIHPSSDLNRKNNPIYDIKLNEIASKSRIGINTIYRLFNMVKQSGETDYTSREISEELGITIRSANRLFGKLTEGGYIKMVGEKSTGEKGRPIRVFRFLF